MRTALKIAASLGAMTGLGGLGVRRQAAAIRALQDPFDLDVLQRDPGGETVWVDRPDGARLRMVVAGEGPTVLLSHGYAVSLVEWNIVMPRLVAAGHRVVAFDWRGHGGSTVGSAGVTPEAIGEDHVAMLDALDIQNAVLVGHSTGGYLAIAALLDCPAAAARITGLVLVASLAGDVLKGAPQNRAQIPLIKAGVMRRVAATDDLGLLFASTVYGKRPSLAACTVFQREFAGMDHAPILGLLGRLGSSGYYDRLGEITVPTVVICGEDDATTPRWHSESMGRNIPNARNVWVPAAGHMLNWQAPDEIVEAVVSLTTVEPAIMIPETMSDPVS